MSVSNPGRPTLTSCDPGVKLKSCSVPVPYVCSLALLELLASPTLPLCSACSSRPNGLVLSLTTLFLSPQGLKFYLCVSPMDRTLKRHWIPLQVFVLQVRFPVTKQGFKVLRDFGASWRMSVRENENWKGTDSKSLYCFHTGIIQDSVGHCDVLEGVVGKPGDSMRHQK